MMIRLKWPDNDYLTILNIYAPVKRSDQPDFWATIEIERRVMNLPCPDFLLGNFNITEDAIDRAPQKYDNHLAADTLREIRLSWEVQDQWRHAHPNEKLYTYRYVKNRKTKLSRLDRIYSARKHAQIIFDWKTEPTAVPTDHWLISLKYAPKDAPQIGNGHWTWPIPTLNEEPLLDAIVAKGKIIQTKLENLQNGLTTRDETNPQTLWEDYKIDLQKIAKSKADKFHYKATSRIKRLDQDRKELLDDPNFEYDDDIRAREAFLASEIKHVTSAHTNKGKEDLHAKILHHGEKLGSIWSTINKEKKPRDLI
ncbi:hypothetical protein BGY98DRAFT_936483 [Russula aff. rugulosa BPL654]|nr:hypothetical protein BGY98DRAFT_936483 [Russula aff. rugulosa BPL654]